MPTLRLLCVPASVVPRDRRSLAGLIGAENPDVVCVHGAPSGPQWRAACAALARDAALVVVGGGRPAGANLLLSSLAVDVVNTRDVRLDRSARWRPGAAAALAVLRREGVALAVAAARLTGDSTARRAQLTALERALGELGRDAPAAVRSVEGADGPGNAVWQELASGRVALGSGVFVDGRFAIERATNVGKPNGGGEPLCVTLSLPPRS